MLMMIGKVTKQIIETFSRIEILFIEVYKINSHITYIQLNIDSVIYITSILMLTSYYT